MALLLIRHAHAEEREVWNKNGKSDVLRPLTQKGIVRFATTVEGLSSFVKKIDFIYSSQYTRAVQTMEILHGFYNEANFEITEDLNPDGNISKLIKSLSKHTESQVVALISHEPIIGQIASELISENTRARIRLKKGGVGFISMNNQTRVLQWLMSQRQLAFFSESKKQNPQLESLIGF
jgi:phosphohistidine phosphatase